MRDAIPYLFERGNVVRSAGVTQWNLGTDTKAVAVNREVSFGWPATEGTHAPFRNPASTHRKGAFQNLRGKALARRRSSLSIGLLLLVQGRG